MSCINTIISDHCPQGVEFMSLGDVCIIKTGPNINKTVIAERPGPYPVINSGRDPLGYVDHFNTENDPIGIASRGSVGLVTWTPGKFFRGNLNYSCTVKSPRQLNVRFLYHYLLHADADIQALATHDGIPALNAGSLKTLQVPILPNEIQGEIVRILDTFTELTAKLTAELTARKKQYNHYRDQLLSFEEGAMEWKALGNLVKINTGSKPSEILECATSFDYINAGTSRSGYSAEKNCEGDTVTTPSRGQGGIGYVGYQSKPFWLGPLCYKLQSTDLTVLINKYLFYFLQSRSEMLLGLKKEGGVPAVNKSDLVQLEIPVPSLEEQKRIVAILDKFDALTNSITEGLPREIELRQKQYAYYRDLLLNFPKPKAVEV